MTYAFFVHFKEFQSTPLRERRLDFIDIHPHVAEVSIHAPAREATRAARSRQISSYPPPIENTSKPLSFRGYDCGPSPRPTDSRGRTQCSLSGEGATHSICKRSCGWSGNWNCERPQHEAHKIGNRPDHAVSRTTDAGREHLGSQGRARSPKTEEPEAPG
jgi:hypothetical protein